MPAAANKRGPRVTSECADENEILDFWQGRMLGAARSALEGHIDRCAPCRRVVSAMACVGATTGGSGANGPAEPTTEVAHDGFLPVGEAVDRYVIRGALGAGSMGVVYAARDPLLERDVAIKVVKVARADEVRTARGRLLREARALARLSHPNVVGVHDAREYGDDMFLVLELLDGPNLRDWLRALARRRGEVIGTLVAAGRGLAAAHAVGIVHRDVKPENVVVAHDGRVGMTDFGLAALEGGDGNRAADSGVLIGTLAYMSPEQLWSQPAGPASDQFSFAVMAYEALFGVHPFAGRTVDERRRSVQGGPKRMQGSALSRVLCRGLRMDPAARYPSLDGLLDKLDRLRALK